MSETKKLRCYEWFGNNDKMGFVHRSWLRNQGHPDHIFQNIPVIGICNTWSDLTPCNAHLCDFAEIVKRGVYEAGGFPLDQGCDFDFLKSGSGSSAHRDIH